MNFVIIIFGHLVLIEYLNVIVEIKSLLLLIVQVW